MSTNAELVKDDLTTMSRPGLKKTITREGHDIPVEVEVNLTTDELREKIRESRRAKGIVGLTLVNDNSASATPPGEPAPPEEGDDEGEGDGAPAKDTWKLVLPALPLRQLGRDCFIARIAYRDLDKIEVDREVQRPESKARIPGIANYVASDDGYFLPVMVTIHGAADGHVMYDAAELVVASGARIVVNDGQHRIAGIKRAIADGLIDGDRLNDDLALLVYTDLSVEEQRQAFTDINANAKKPPRAIMDAYDERDLLRRFAHDVVKSTKVFAGKVNFVKTKIGAKDRELLTFSNIVDACGELFDDLSPDTYGERLGEAVEFFEQVDAALGQAWEAKSFANTKNALVAVAKLRGMNVDWRKLANLDWSADGELARIAGAGGGTNGAIKALTTYLKSGVIE